MKRIIIFTNADSLATIDFNSISRRPDILLLKQNEILFFQDKSQTFEIATNFELNGLYFVFDEINENNFNQLITGSVGEYFILKHTYPEFNLDRFNPNVYHGFHSKSLGSNYLELLTLVLDGRDDKVNRIIERIFISNPLFEVKYELLESCRFPEISPPSLPNTLPEVSNAFKSFADNIGNIKVKKKWNDDNYIKELTKLRIKLLGS